PFLGDADRILFVRFARVTPRVGDPQDVIEIRQLGLLVPLVPCRTVLVLATLAISVVLVSPFGESFVRGLTPVLLTAYGVFLLAAGLARVFSGPSPALRHVEEAAVGGIVLLPFYFACWLSFAIACVAGILIYLRARWGARLAVWAQAALVVSVWGLLLPAVETQTGYRVERLDPLLYGAVTLSALALPIWFLRRTQVRACFAPSRPEKGRVAPGA